MPGIVVGVDGSPNSTRALDWAMRQAAAVHAPLTLVAVHEVPKSYWGGIPVTGPADGAAAQEGPAPGGRGVAEQAAARLGDAPPTIGEGAHAVSGFVVKELVDASHDADLVVLGAPGASSGLSRILIGSVSGEVVQHSACPVVIVPHEK